MNAIARKSKNTVSTDSSITVLITSSNDGTVTGSEIGFSGVVEVADVGLVFACSCTAATIISPIPGKSSEIASDTSCARSGSDATISAANCKSSVVVTAGGSYKLKVIPSIPSALTINGFT